MGLSIALYGTIDFSKLRIENLSNTISIATSVPTLIIAILLYKRFSGSQLLVDKQTKEVMDLLDHINDMNIVIQPEKLTFENIKELIITDIWLRDTAIVETTFKDYGKKRYKDYVFYASKNLHEVADYFMYLEGSLYMPRKIAKKLDKHFNRESYWWVGHSDKKSRKKKYLFVDIGSRKYFDTKEYEISRPEFVHVDVYALSESIVDIYETAANWIKENNPEIFKQLNIKSYKDNE